MKTKLLLIGLVLCHTVLSQKIFPGAEGFGTNSRAAYETGNTPTILIVNTLSSGNFSTGINSGTFLWCLEQDYPRIIVFSVGGVIDYSGTVMTIRVRNPYLTIYGQTAPSPGIIIKGANIDLVTQHVLIQHVKFRIGDDIRDQVPDARDCLGFYDPGDNIVIDHCSFEWSIDELIGISSKTAGHYTISNSILAEPLRRSIHYGDKMQPEKHNLYMLTSSNGNGSSLTMKNNLLAFGEGRSPAVTLSNAIIINDLVYGGKGVADIRNADGNQSLICAIGNKMIPLLSPSMFVSIQQYAVYIGSVMSSDSRLFVADNECKYGNDNPSATQWDMVGKNERITQAITPPLDISEYTILPHSQVEDYVLENAGAFFWDRDYVDKRVVDSVRYRGITLIDSPDSIPAFASLMDQKYYTEAGDMSNGFNWENTPQTIAVNGHTIHLTQNCTNITEVVDHINSQIPNDVECFRLNAYTPLNWVGIRTKKKGYGQVLALSDDGLETLGIPEGTYYGMDGRGYDFSNTTRQLTIPENPHGDDDGNGYTNIEEWAFNFSNNNDSVNHSPQISPNTFNITDTMAQGTLIGKIQATDPDLLQTLTFSITGGNTDNRYSINASTGDLFVNNTINVSEDETDNLIIQVMDNGEGNITSSATITINVQHYVYVPENHSPVINDQVFNITDTLATNSIIGRISASDPDNNQTLSFSILDGNTNNRYHLESSSGDLILNNPISINSNTTDELQVQVMDNGKGDLTASATITVKIEHFEIVQNHSPVIQNQIFSVLCPENKGWVVGTMLADDPDVNQTITYSIISTNANPLFSVNSSTGEIMLNEDINAGELIEYQLKIQVTDNAPQSLSDSAIAFISVYPEHKIYYINPDNNNDSFEDGSYAHPYNSWKDVKWKEGYSYLQKAGTKAYEEKINIGSGNVSLSSYGEGSVPVIYSLSSDFAIRAYEKSNITISDLHLIAHDAISSIYILGISCDSNVIQNCIFEDSDCGIRIIDGKSITVKYNTFKNMVNGIYSFCENNNVYYNLFKGNLTAINISSYISEAHIYNNIFYDNIEGVSTSYSSLTLYNNIFYLVDVGNLAINHKMNNITSDYNIFYPEQKGFINIADNKYDILEDYRNESGEDIHSFSTNPLFIDIDNDNFNVSAESPAINAGKFVGLLEDYIGSKVPNGIAPDIGLAESQEYPLTSSPYINGSITEEDNLINIYPNPSKGRFRIKTMKYCNNIKVYNLSGNIIYEVNNSDTENKEIFMDISEQPEGVYILRIHNNSEIYTRSIIIE